MYIVTCINQLDNATNQLKGSHSSFEEEYYFCLSRSDNPFETKKN